MTLYQSFFCSIEMFEITKWESAFFMELVWKLGVWDDLNAFSYMYNECLLF